MSDAPRFVKVTKLGEEVKTYSLADGETVDEMLAKAGLGSATGEVKINGIPRGQFTRPLRDGDLITVSANIKGGLAA